MPLLVCATPIGNLEDITFRVIRELGAVDLVLCEDTRRTRVLLDRYGVAPPLTRYDRHTEARRTAELLPQLDDGRRIALVSDAGLPGINDPGSRLIVAALQRGVEVSVLPGPSAVETALVASGLLADRYAFLGYLPRSDAGRAALWQELTGWAWPAVAFESPKRVPASLASLAEVHPGRPAAVCRELTKRFEEVVRGTARELAERFAEAPKGEVTIVIGAAAGRDVADLPEASAAVAELTASGVPRRQAARIVGELVGLPPNRLYRRSL